MKCPDCTQELEKHPRAEHFYRCLNCKRGWYILDGNRAVEIGKAFAPFLETKQIDMIHQLFKENPKT